MTTLQREEWSIEIETSAWAEILNFLGKCGWQPSVPGYYLLASGYTVSDEVALSLAQAGEVVMEDAMKNPLDRYSSITFDISKFSEIIEFASHGAFVIRS